MARKYFPKHVALLVMMYKIITYELYFITSRRKQKSMQNIFYMKKKKQESLPKGETGIDKTRKTHQVL